MPNWVILRENALDEKECHLIKVKINESNLARHAFLIGQLVKTRPQKNSAPYFGSAVLVTSGESFYSVLRKFTRSVLFCAVKPMLKRVL